MKTRFQRLAALVLFGLVWSTCAATAQTFTVLYSFTGGTDGGDPIVGLTKDSAGNLYGATNSGGDLTCRTPYGCGVVFKLDPSGELSVLKTFHESTSSSDLTLEPRGCVQAGSIGRGNCALLV
jgi:uncharacterized repeat protein (TIGR03803 family)